MGPEGLETRLTLGEQLKKPRQDVDTGSANDEQMPLVLVNQDGLLQPREVPFAARVFPYLNEPRRIDLEEPAKSRTIVGNDVVGASWDGNDVVLVRLAILAFVGQ